MSTDGAGYDLVITGGAVVTPHETFVGDVGIVGEKIVALSRRGELAPRAAQVIDASNCLVLPGGVDPHCHYNVGFAGVYAEPPEWSAAAAYGGTTTIIDFAFQIPPTSLHDAIEQKKDDAAGKMPVDYGLHAILTGAASFEVIDEIGDVIRNGIPTIKTFTTYPGVMMDDGHRWGVLQEVAQHGGLSIVHAEDDSLAEWLTKKYLHEGKTHGAYISETRGALVEEAAIRRVLLLAERAGSPLYILHMAAGAGVAALAEARSRGLPVYGETLIAYLSFTADRLWDDDNRGLLWNNIPPIKFEEDRQALWKAIRNDSLQVVATDHFAVSARERYELEGTTVDQLQAGQAAVELRLPVLFHLGVRGGLLSLERFVELTATNPAKIMGLYPDKGRIGIGSDADIVVIDPERTWTVNHEELHMNVDWNCWDGWELTGQVTHTILRGCVLVEHGNFVGPKAGGRFVPRRLLPEVIRSADGLRSVQAPVFDEKARPTLATT
jgi:dihydropyrimidinase